MSGFSKIFKQLRNNAKMTQQELATKIGVSRSAIGMYESGEREPDFETLETIADYFNVDMDYLLGRTERNMQIHTIAAHHDSEEWTQEELDEIEEFKKFVLSKRK